jgi:hypothetical protein
MTQLQETYPRLFLFHNERGHDTAPDVAQMIAETTDLRIGLISETIEAGITEGVFREGVNPRLIARLIIGMCTDVRFWWRPGGPMTLIDIGEEISQLVVRGTLFTEDALPSSVRASKKRASGPGLAKPPRPKSATRR